MLLSELNPSDWAIEKVFYFKMKSTEYIDNLLKSEDFQPKPYSHGDWFCKYLNQVLGFHWDDNQPPHYRLRAGNFLVTVSPFFDVIIVDFNHKAFISEIYFHPSIPQNQEEFDIFWNNLKKIL